MRKILIATALTLMCGSAFAQTSTGPAAQQDNVNKPGMTGSQNTGSMTSGSANNSMSNGGSAMNKDGMAKDGMAKGGASKDGDGQMTKGGTPK